MLLNWCLIVCLSVCHLALDTASPTAAATLGRSTGTQTKLVQMFVPQARIRTDQSTLFLKKGPFSIKYNHSNCCSGSGFKQSYVQSQLFIASCCCESGVCRSSHQKQVAVEAAGGGGLLEEDEKIGRKERNRHGILGILHDKGLLKKQKNQ